MSKEWTRVQECHERRRQQETASHGRRVSWDVRAVRLVCEFNYDLWNFRNDEVHGRTQQEARQKLRDSVEAKVKALYARHPILLARYPSVHSMPLAARLKKPTLVLQMWIKQVLQQEFLNDIARQKAKMKEGSILRFLVPRSAIAMGAKVAGGQIKGLEWNAADTLVRWARQLLRHRSKVELPRA
mmetsp:Transcript_5532/g.8164  ORF Transcript_5532/g.8164 Transcript_5532/m.8164 type:complete len:185 (+) Transcript_5532:530-1084(+)